MTGSRFARPDFEWAGPSTDPADEQFGDVVEPRSIDETGDCEAVLVGEPYDGAVIGRLGAREGPAALRRELAATKTHHFEAGPVGAVGDLGDVRIPEGDAGVRAVQSAVAEAAAAVHGADALPVFLGGDNSLTYANAVSLLGDREVAAVSFDAHLDCRRVEDGPTSGTPYRQLFEAGLGGYACVGARHFETSTVYHEYIRERGGRIETAERAAADPVGVAEAALAATAGADALYVSVDLDVLDAAAAPGVSAPTPGGIASRDLFRALRRVAADDRVVGFEVVECAPPLDRDDATARAGARAVAHFLAGAGVGGGGGTADGDSHADSGGDLPC